RDVHQLAFSPRGDQLAASGRSEVRVWDTATGDLLWTATPRSFSTSLCFSPDGKRLAIGCDTPTRPDDVLLIYDAATGHELLAVKRNAEQDGTAHAFAMTFGAEGRWLVGACTDGTLRFWEAAPPSALTLRRPGVGPSALVFLADGNRLVLAAAGDRPILWD